ncbi:putative ibr finger domain protein [Botrytis fragariae]|uniref:RBR-type E3 ubiquitin transferase n=1 Tax=Botrytis fragariae TaxID=1964551 RepID=A0A8H6AJI7_9HELO|nr:putative ibr finger domain protein [Botrytis fragariae]KAF5868614.1 putative ibr finger domain protein [Botrytis fragariae]
MADSSSRRAANLRNNRQTGSNKNPAQLKCIVCGEFQDFQQMATFPCDCVYCSTCLQRRFTRAIEAEFMFPVKCCWDFNLTPFHHLLPPDIIRDYEAKKIEYETVDRTYCANKVCSAFIMKENIKGHKAFCAKSPCNTITCTKCKSGWHDGECPRDQDQELVLAEAQRQGWKRCAKCGNLIEYVDGCCQIECRCGYEFCYCCAAPWETCLCNQIDLDRLLGATNGYAGNENSIEVNEDGEDGDEGSDEDSDEDDDTYADLSKD